MDCFNYAKRLFLHSMNFYYVFSVYLGLFRWKIELRGIYGDGKKKIRGTRVFIGEEVNAGGFKWFLVLSFALKFKFQAFFAHSTHQILLFLINNCKFRFINDFKPQFLLSKRTFTQQLFKILRKHHQKAHHLSFE